MALMTADLDEFLAGGHTLRVLWARPCFSLVVALQGHGCCSPRLAGEHTEES